MSETKNTDWRNHTCGECGWWALHEKPCYMAAERDGICRRCKFSIECTVSVKTPACPAFVAKKEEES